VGLFDRLFRRQKPAPAVDDPITVMVSRLRQACLQAETRYVSADFFCYFPDEASATAAAREAINARYRTVVDVSDGTYALQATCTLELDEALVRDHVVWFEELARRHGGEYDGWGALPSVAS
jgi:Regulator of ribonuclease activity B